MEIMEVLYNFNNLHEMVKYEEFYERSCGEEFHANCLMKKTRKRLFLRMKLKIQEHCAAHMRIRKYVRQHHMKRPPKGDLVVSKEVSISEETKKEQENLYFI